MWEDRVKCWCFRVPGFVPHHVSSYWYQSIMKDCRTEILFSVFLGRWALQFFVFSSCFRPAAKRLHFLKNQWYYWKIPSKELKDATQKQGTIYNLQSLEESRWSFRDTRNYRYFMSIVKSAMSLCVLNVIFLFL